MRQGADADAIHAGLGDRPKRRQRHAAGRLQQDARRRCVPPPHRLAQQNPASCCPAIRCPAGPPAPRRTPPDRPLRFPAGSAIRMARARRTASATAAGPPPTAARWLSLMRTPSPRPMRWLWPPPRRTAYFSSRRQPGVVLRVSNTWQGSPATAWTYFAVCVATPLSRCTKFSRGSLAGQDGAHPAADDGQHRPRRHGRAVGDERLKGQLRVDDGEGLPGGRQSGDDAGGARDQGGPAGQVRRDDGPARQVSLGAEVHPPARGRSAGDRRWFQYH